MQNNDEQIGRPFKEFSETKAIIESLTARGGDVAYDETNGVFGFYSDSFGRWIWLGREFLVSNRTYYIRTDGSDSNDGLTNSSGGAFATFDKAWDTLLTIDTAGYTVTIKYGNSGTYTDQILVDRPWLGGGQVIIEGDTTTPSSIVISNATAMSITASLPAALTIQGFKFTGASGGIDHQGVNTLFVQNIEYAVTGGAHIWARNPGAMIDLFGNYSITAGANRHFQASTGGVIRVYSGITITLTGTPNFSLAFAVVLDGGQLVLNNTTSPFSGSATGQRYRVYEGGVIRQAGTISESYLPGNSVGLVRSGGQYADQEFNSRNTAQFDKTNTTLANITGISISVLAGRTYRFRAVFYTTSNVAGGVKFDLNGGTATMTAIIAEAMITQAGAMVAPGTSRVTALGTTFANVTAVTVATVIIDGTFTVNAAGTIIPRFACNAATGTSSILVGSVIEVEDIT